MKALTISAAALLLALAGCGSDDEQDSTTGTGENRGADTERGSEEIAEVEDVETTEDGTRRCPPAPRAAASGGGRGAPPGRSVRVPFPKHGTTLVVQVESAHRATQVGGDGGYEATDGEFVVVTYRVRNVGEESLEAAAVNGFFGIEAGGKLAYGRAETAPGCKASTLFAKKASPPAEPAEANLDPGTSYRTVAAYVVPQPGRQLTWAARDGSRRLRLKLEPAS